MTVVLMVLIAPFMSPGSLKHDDGSYKPNVSQQKFWACAMTKIFILTNEDGTYKKDARIWFATYFSIMFCPMDTPLPLVITSHTTCTKHPRNLWWFCLRTFWSALKKHLAPSWFLVFNHICENLSTVSKLQYCLIISAPKSMLFLIAIIINSSRDALTSDALNPKPINHAFWTLIKINRSNLICSLMLHRILDCIPRFIQATSRPSKKQTFKSQVGQCQWGQHKQLYQSLW